MNTKIKKKPIAAAAFLTQSAQVSAKFLWGKKTKDCGESRQYIYKLSENVDISLQVPPPTS